MVSSCVDTVSLCLVFVPSLRALFCALFIVPSLCVKLVCLVSCLVAVHSLGPSLGLEGASIWA